MRKVIFICCCALVVILMFANDFSIWENLSIAIFFYFLLDFLETLGKRINILELINVMAAFTCLLMPVVFYHEYTIQNPLAKLWYKYMPVDSENYFSFMIPAFFALAWEFDFPWAG